MIWSLVQSAWHFIFGWAGVDMLIGFAAVAVAVFEPKFLDAVTDLRKWAIATAVVAFTCTGLLAHGYKNGYAERDRQLLNSLAQEARDGENDHDKAVASDGALPTSRELLRSDSRNRDRGKRSGSK